MSLKGLLLEGLSWTTTDADIIRILEEKTETLVEIHFDQCAYNGKSNGSVYLRFTTSAAAQAAKKPLEKQYNVSLATRNPYIRTRDDIVDTAPIPPQMMPIDTNAMMAGVGDQWAAYQAAMQPGAGSRGGGSPDPMKKSSKKKRSSRTDRPERESSRSEKRPERDRSVKLERDRSEKPERRMNDIPMPEKSGSMELETIHQEPEEDRDHDVESHHSGGGGAGRHKSSRDGKRRSSARDEYSSSRKSKKRRRSRRSRSRTRSRSRSRSHDRIDDLGRSSKR